jgi:hypothetical protein
LETVTGAASTEPSAPILLTAAVAQATLAIPTLQMANSRLFIEPSREKDTRRGSRGFA